MSFANGRIDGVAAINLPGHTLHLIRCQIQESVNAAFLVFTDPKDGMLYGFDIFTIESMKFGLKSTVTCRIDTALIREDEVGYSDGTDEVKIYLSKSGYKNVRDIAENLSIPTSFVTFDAPLNTVADVYNSTNSTNPFTQPIPPSQFKRVRDNDNEDIDSIDSSEADTTEPMDTDSNDPNLNESSESTQETYNPDSDEVESTDTMDTDSDEIDEDEIVEPIEPPKKKGWFSWLW